MRPPLCEICFDRTHKLVIFCLIVKKKTFLNSGLGEFIWSSHFWVIMDVGAMLTQIVLLSQKVNKLGGPSRSTIISQFIYFLRVYPTPSPVNPTPSHVGTTFRVFSNPSFSFVRI